MSNLKKHLPSSAVKSENFMPPLEEKKDKMNGILILINMIQIIKFALSSFKLYVLLVFQSFCSIFQEYFFDLTL